MGHPFSRGEKVYDVTFENVQAGLRTDYLFRLANHNGALVCGTGDLSELGLGWCTYGVVDQLTQANVYAGIPETEQQHELRRVVDSEQLGTREDEPGEVMTAKTETETTPARHPWKINDQTQIQETPA
mgnify:CR=1 FL=1